MNFGLTECVVRVNSIGSGLMEEDLKVITEAEKLPQTIFVPKVNSTQELAAVSICVIFSFLICRKYLEAFQGLLLTPLLVFG